MSSLGSLSSLFGGLESPWVWGGVLVAVILCSLIAYVCSIWRRRAIRARATLRQLTKILEKRFLGSITTINLSKRRIPVRNIEEQEEALDLFELVSKLYRAEARVGGKKFRQEIKFLQKHIFDYMIGVSLLPTNRTQKIWDDTSLDIEDNEEALRAPIWHLAKNSICLLINVTRWPWNW